MRGSAYYNEFEPFAAQWLRNLIAAGHIAPGDVDDRSIVDVHPADLIGYDQCHFFAGIGGWSLALRLAGWADNREVWTGSCPCQPFSVAGDGAGARDPRHLWPEWFRLIAECRPHVVFGEQVAAAARRGWLDAVALDLEAEGYAFGAAILPAASVGAPHIRDRLWFVADARGEQLRGEPWRRSGAGWSGTPVTGVDGAAQHVADAGGARLPLPEREAILGAGRGQEGRAAAERGWWAAEPSVGRVAHGVPGRVGRLRAYGNAIVPQVAAEVVKAFMEVCP